MYCFDKLGKSENHLRSYFRRFKPTSLPTLPRRAINCNTPPCDETVVSALNLLISV
jgi:hypothetical protein